MRFSNVSISHQIYTLGRYHGGSSRRSSRPSLAGTHDLLSPICSHNVVSVSQKHDTFFLPITSVTSVSFRHIAGGGEIPPGNSKSAPGNFCWCKFLNVVPALLAYTAVFKAFVKKSCRQVRYSSSKYTKCVRGRGFGPNPTGEAYRAPRPPSWFSWSCFAVRRGGKTGK